MLKFKNPILHVSITPKLVALARRKQASGRCWRSECCPNALAINKALKSKFRRHKFVSHVGVEHCNIYEGYVLRPIVSVVLPKAARDVVRQYDSGQTVNPVEFDIDLSRSRRY
jgi:hypothetical protein